MKLRRKALMPIGVTSILTIIVLQLTSQTILLNSFATLENEEFRPIPESLLEQLTQDNKSLQN